MKTVALIVAVATLLGCQKGTETSPAAPAASMVVAHAESAPPAPQTGGRLVASTGGAKDIVGVAVGSPDHTTLVAALKAADLVESLASPGPYTVFAPTNAAFDKLPKGTVEGLLVPDKKEDLKKILEYHVAVSVYQTKDMHDGQKLGMANGGNVVFHVKDGKVMVNDANIVASVMTANGIVHVIDGVLLPAAKP
ncbi:MAG: fasciclin domain-containing protein [Polyangiales bacterium]